MWKRTEKLQNERLLYKQGGHKEQVLRAIKSLAFASCENQMIEWMEV